MRHRLVGLPVRQFVLFAALLCAVQLGGQVQPPAAPPSDTSDAATADTTEPGAIKGIVMSDSTGEPLRRAQVLLRPAGKQSGGAYQTTDETGSFSFPKVTPGRYTITVERDGYLPLSAGRIGAYKMPPIFMLQPGQSIDSFVFRMQAWGIISGKVRFDDAEPAVNVVIQLYREYYDRGRHGYAVAASTHTDDRGEYRLHGLEPGSYYVAALYQAPPRPADAQEQPRSDAAGQTPPGLSYAVTFFPQVQRMADAVPVRVAAGQEAGGVDIFLTLVHTVRIRGRVTSGVSGKVLPNPALTLRWNDPDNTASVSAPINVTLDSNQNFEIQGVTPGPYLLVATGSEDGATLTGRVPINIGDSDIANLDVVAGAESLWKGKIRVEGGDAALPPGEVVMLEPRRPTASTARAEVAANGEFAVPFVPNETYDLYVLNAPDDAYLESVRVANAERLADGLQAASGDAPPPLDVALSFHGGQVVGKAVLADPSVVASGATVMLLPDPPNGRVQAYKTTFADEYGNFFFPGVAPGNYVVLGWLDQAPCEVYNPGDLAACRAHGANLTVEADGQETVQVTAN